MKATWPQAAPREVLAHPDLVKLAKQRDSAAWSTIYSQHYDPIFRYLYGRLGSKEEAEDLASQVFLEALKSIDSFADRGKPLGAWLYGIARNLANNQFRSQRKRGESDALRDDDVEDSKAIVGDPQAASLDLIAGISELTKEQRETLLLRFYVGLSAKEVAVMLGKTEQAIYALQVRAVAALRRLMSDDFDGDESAARIAS
jgi:RNA polymerase sigma-70 factor (ECF subfamily)